MITFSISLFWLVIMIAVLLSLGGSLGFLFAALMAAASRRPAAAMPETEKIKLAENQRRERAAVLPQSGMGDFSDGYHTFNELYHHRAVLFSVICNSRPEISWKSKLHHDGTMYDGMFIVGIQTSQGQATYHYNIDPYWEMFSVPELPAAPEWDGHTSDQAIERIGSLTTQICRICGCTWLNGCPGGCYWVEDDLCSSCAARTREDE